MTEKCWVIIDISEVFDCSNRRDGFGIPPSDRPSFIHKDKDKAETELLRLKKRSPHCEFVLFDAVASADPQITDTGLFEINKIEAERR